MSIRRSPQAIAGEFSWERDTDNEGGWVAAIDVNRVMEIGCRFYAAGYEYSTSRDVDGQMFIWVKPDSV